MHKSFAPSSALAAFALFGFSACGALSFSQDTKYGVSEVDDLLTRVERVQVEAVLSKEKAHAAYDALHAIVASEFEGEPVTAYTALMNAIDQSKKQAAALSGSIEPMKMAATAVFQEWTTNLESFGNTKMRQASQARMEETRARYETILTHAVSARIAYDTFNADLHDNALFLEHDFNASAVSAIATEVDALGDQSHELDRRLDACVNAAKSYVEAAALRGQLETPNAEVKEPAPKTEKATTTTTRRLRAKPTSTTTTPTAQPANTAPQSTPAPTSTPTPTPAPQPTPPANDTPAPGGIVPVPTPVNGPTGSKP